MYYIYYDLLKIKYLYTLTLVLLVNSTIKIMNTTVMKIIK